MLTICLLVLAALYLKRPINVLAVRLKNVGWKTHFDKLRDHIAVYAKKAGRVAARPLLQFYYVVTTTSTTTIEKATIYACIAYVVLPFSILPKAVYKLLGIMDETAAVLFVLSKVKNKITPEINNRVDDTLDRWFGADYTVIA
jgi:uncharacterized membrane protein YkvA (DUF1232 family)